MENKSVENIVKYQEELTQESLSSCIIELEENLKQINGNIDDLTNEIEIKKRALEDLNKPSLTQKQFDLINDGLDNFMSNLRFSEQDFDLELTIGYENKVEIEHITFNNQHDMMYDMMRWIRKEFKIIQEKSNEDENV